MRLKVENLGGRQGRGPDDICFHCSEIRTNAKQLGFNVSKFPGSARSNRHNRLILGFCCRFGIKSDVGESRRARVKTDIFVFVTTNRAGGTGESGTLGSNGEARKRG